MKATILKAGTLIEDNKILVRRAMMKHTNDMTKLPTYEILYRVYKRHSVGFWMTLTAATYVWIVWSKLG